MAALAGLVLVDQAGVQVGVDRHLLAGHGVEGEAGADLGHAAGTVGDDDELDDGQDQEDHQTDDQRAADHEVPEGLDDLAGVAVGEHQPGRGDVQRQPEQGRHEQQRREDGEVQRLLDLHRDQQDQQRGGDVDREQHVDQRRRQRHDQHEDDRDDADRHRHLAHALHASLPGTQSGRRITPSSSAARRSAGTAVDPQPLGAPRRRRRELGPTIRRPDHQRAASGGGCRRSPSSGLGQVVDAPAARSPAGGSRPSRRGRPGA